MRPYLLQRNIWDQYEILESLGEGSYGKVVLAKPKNELDKD